jgi:tetratricopeptide (TPR) repeat protein
MLELDRLSLGDLPHLRSQFHLHLAVVCVFTGRIDEGLDSIAQALEGGRLSPGTTADLRMYRAVALTKRMGRIGEARQEIEAGLAALAGSPRSTAALHEGWLRNLYALTYFQEKNLDQARHQEELALACIDGVPGPSATHLKTNLVSNFSVLAEAGGDIPTAIRVWRTFESLNRRLGSDSADKVHAYRLGTLQFLNGDADGAIASFETAFQKAEASGDVFNGETIAAALGRLYLARGGGGDAESSELWYRRAAARALFAGDCLHLARDRVGLTLASAGRDFSSARESLACNSTYQLEGLRLPTAVAADDRAAMLEALPLPKSKMARPFDLVNV